MNHVRPLLSPAKVRDTVLRPVLTMERTFYLIVFPLGVLCAWGLFAWAVQLYKGVGVTGLNRPIFWGLYMVNFVFWVGISHAGTMISSILRLTGAEWRRPITRAAEAMTVCALIVAGAFPIVHLGRAWRVYYLIPYPNFRGLTPNFRSPLMWDATAIMTYLLGSSLFLYVGMIPDFAILRDRTTGWRHKVYGFLSMNWRGTQREWKWHTRAMDILMVLIIPVFVSVHSIVAWDFGVSLVPFWHSALFAPFFVIGAVLSGVSAVVTLMIAVRKLLHLEDLIRAEHFNNLGKMILAVSIIWAYLWFAEFITAWYARDLGKEAVVHLQMTKYLPLYIIQMAFNFVIPFVTLPFKKIRTSIPAMLVITVLVNVGMYVERFLIIPGALARQHLPSVWALYRPTWVGISISLGALSGFLLLYTLFTKFFPPLGIWEISEGEVKRGTIRVGQATVETIARLE